jgi:hypothetical protein
MILKKLRDVLSFAACAVLVLALTAGPVLADCYECDGPYSDGQGHQWMECWHPVDPGHVSCVPYVTTCSVGGACGGGGGGGGGKTFRAPLVAPDGSFATETVVGATFDDQGVARNCLGFVIARAYDASRLEDIREASSIIRL